MSPIIMFERKRTLFFLSKTKLRVAEGACGADRLLERGQYKWTPESLQDVIANLPGTLPKISRIVVSEALGYVVPLACDEQLDRKNAETRSESAIPEVLDRTTWDYQCIADRKTGQAAALLPGIADLLGKSFSSFDTESVELESVALSRVFGDSDGIAVVSEESDILIAYGQGRVLATEVLEEYWSDTHVTLFSAFVEKRFSKKMETILVSENAQDERSGKHLREKGFSLFSQPMDPLLGTLRKKDVSGRDRNVLNIRLVGKRAEPVSFGTVSVRKAALIVVFSIAMFGILAGVFFR